MSDVEVSWILGDAPPEVHALALEWMQPEERQRHDRFAFEHSRAEYRIARWLVRTTLSRHAPVDPAAWRFVANEYGRPEIAKPLEHRDLRFNLSHTKGLVAIAVARGREVGIDVEDCSRPIEMAGIIHRYFAPIECRDLMALATEAERQARFFDLWTLKESYIKARGMGLALSLDGFAFTWRDGQLAFQCDERTADAPERWDFSQYRPSARHRLALAAERLDGDLPRIRQTRN